VIAVAPAVKKEDKFIVSNDPPPSIVLADMLPFVVGPPEHDGVGPLVTYAGCDTVSVQSINPLETLE
jgi:hypothetical protein